jgi:hypothetical protein
LIGYLGLGEFSVSFSLSFEKMKDAIVSRYRKVNLCGVLTMLLVSGCGPSDSSRNVPSAVPLQVSAHSSSQVSGQAPSQVSGQSQAEVSLVRYRDLDGEDLLRQVFEKYGRSRAYSDEGELVATTVDSSKRIVSKASAPMSVWFSEDRVYVRAYQARVWSDGRKLTGWIRSDETDNFDSQVLSLDVPAGRPQDRTIVVDPVLASAVGGGAGGPPPQLEWLFARSPMSGLFEGESQFEKGDRSTIDEVSCQAISVTNAGEKFVFWIDIDRSLIRRIELPRMQIMDASAKSPQQVQLVLDLHEATFAEQTVLPVFDPMPDRPRFVKRLIPLPPTRPLEDVPASISMNNLRIESKPDASRVGGETVFWMTHTRSNSTMEWLQELRRVWSKDNTGTIEIIEDRSVDEESLWIVDHRGTVHFAQSLTPPVVPETMMAVTTDLAAKVNVRERLIQQWQTQNQQYLDALKEASVK